jgi:hypothetical protein
MKKNNELRALHKGQILKKKWLEKAEKEGLIEVAAELKMAIDHAHKASRHLAQAGYLFLPFH